MYCDLTLELTEVLEADVCVSFNCSFPGSRATYYDPPEPPEFDITDVEINTLFGSSYEKTSEELYDAGWLSVVEEKAREALEANDEQLYEAQLEAYHASECV